MEIKENVEEEEKLVEISTTKFKMNLNKSGRAINYIFDIENHKANIKFKKFKPSIEDFKFE